MDFSTPMLRPIATDTPVIRIVRRDLAGAREWMAAVCGPHWLKVGARPSDTVRTLVRSLPPEAPAVALAEGAPA